MTLFIQNPPLGSRLDELGTGDRSDQCLNYTGAFGGALFFGVGGGRVLYTCTHPPTCKNTQRTFSLGQQVIINTNDSLLQSFIYSKQ